MEVVEPGGRAGQTATASEGKRPPLALLSVKLSVHVEDGHGGADRPPEPIASHEARNSKIKEDIAFSCPSAAQNAGDVALALPLPRWQPHAQPPPRQWALGH